jgi:uncharacterized protein (TIGR04255 family)
MTIPGLIYEKVSNDFPTKREQMGVGGAVRTVEDGVQHRVELSRRIQFVRSDERALIQLGQDLLAINHLAPYPTWAEFKPLILEKLAVYQDVAQPEGLKRLGLRYINKIEFEQLTIESEDYFNYYQHIPEELPQQHGTFSVSTDLRYADGRDCLRMVLRGRPIQEGEAPCVYLDLDYFLMVPEAIALADAPPWIEEAHKMIQNAFEACITDRCRKLFEEEK